MSRSLLALAFLCFAATPALAQDPNAGTITIKKKSLHVGEVLTFSKTKKQTMAMTITAKDDSSRSDKMNRVIDGVAGKTIEILELKDGKVAKIKVTFGKIAKVVTDKQRSDSGEEEKDAISGKSFTVTYADKKVVVTNDKGKIDLSDEQTVTKETLWFFEEQGQGLAAALPVTPIQRNAQFLPPSNALGRLLEIKKEDKNSKITNPKMVFKGQAKHDGVDCASFALSADARSEKFGPMKALIMTMKVTGTVLIEVNTGRVLSIQCVSKVTMSSAPNKLFKARGAGSRTQMKTTKYSEPSSNMQPPPKK